MNGKGSRNRTSNWRAYWYNYDRIKGFGKKPQEDNKQKPKPSPPHVPGEDGTKRA